MDCSHGVRSYLVLVVDVCHTLLRNIEIAVRFDFMGEHGVVGLLVRHGFTKMCRKRLCQFLLIARLEEFGLGNHLAALQVEVPGCIHGVGMGSAGEAVVHPPDLHTVSGFLHIHCDMS